jgi:hypothetical protein
MSANRGCFSSKWSSNWLVVSIWNTNGSGVPLLRKLRLHSFQVGMQKWFTTSQINWSFVAHNHPSVRGPWFKAP